MKQSNNWWLASGRALLLTNFLLTIAPAQSAGSVTLNMVDTKGVIQCPIEDLRSLLKADIAQFKRREKVVFGLSSEGASIFVFSKGQTPVRIRGVYLGETGKGRLEFAHIRGDLAFIVSKTEYVLPLNRSNRVKKESVFTGFVCAGRLIIDGSKSEIGIIDAERAYIFESISREVRDFKSVYGVDWTVPELIPN